MRSSRTKYFIAVFCFFTSLLIDRAPLANDTDPVIARVNDTAIKASEFRRFLLYNVSHIKFFATHELRMQQLERMIEDELTFQDAVQSQVDKDEWIVDELKHLERKAAGRLAYEENVYEKAIPETLVTELYDKMGREVEIRHVLLRVSQDSIRVLERLTRLRSRVVAGEEFGEIARTVSQDSLTAENGGALGYVKWGHRGFGDRFYETAFTLDVGEISQPVRSPLGLHLLTVDGWRDLPKPPLDEIKEDLYREFFAERHAEIRQREAEFIDIVLASARISVNEETLLFLYSAIVELKVTHQFHPAERLNNCLTPTLGAEELGRILIAMQDSSYTVADFLSLEGEKIPIAASVLDTYDQFRKYIVDLIPYDELIAEWALKNQYQLRDRVVKYIAESKRTRMLREIQRIMLEGCLVEPEEEELLEYHKRHQDNYSHPESRKVQEIFVRDGILAREVSERASRGEDFDSLALKYNERSLTKRDNGYLGYVAAQQHEHIGERSATMKVGEVSPPIKSKLGYSIIRVLDFRPKSLKSYEDAKSEVRRDLSRTMLASCRQEWLERLKSKARIEVDEQKLRLAFPETSFSQPD
jgi:parvulin-like peptidyl-prolyl isomerase